jgi:hypothetical protein
VEQTTSPLRTVAASVPVRVLGSPFRIDCPDLPLAGELSRLLAPFADPDGDRTAEVIAASTVDRTLTELNVAALGGADLLALHAGVVARAGRVVAFPGPSGIGKSTLTVACLRAGLEYGSDEALCLDWDTGAVTGYPRPLALTPDAARLAGVGRTADGTADRTADRTGDLAGDRTGDPAEDAELIFTAADLGATIASGPLTLAHLVIPQRATETALRPAPRSAVVAELLRRSFTSHKRPGEAFRLLHRTVTATACWWLDLADPITAAAALSRLLDS